MKPEAMITTDKAGGLAPPSRDLSISEDQFVAWLAEAPPGSAVEYHRGHLAVDRAPGLSPFCEMSRRELVGIADRAMTLAIEGDLMLVQEHHGEGDVGYIAIKPNRSAAPTHSAFVLAGIRDAGQPADEPAFAMGGA